MTEFSDPSRARPHLRKRITTIKSGASVPDQCETPFGIRSIRLDPNKGFVLNGQSLGRKRMNKNSRLEWPVKYAPGTLLAHGYKGAEETATAKVETTGAPAAIQHVPHRTTIKADVEDVTVITFQVNDLQGRLETRRLQRVGTSDRAVLAKALGSHAHRPRATFVTGCPTQPVVLRRALP